MSNVIQFRLNNSKHSKLFFYNMLNCYRIQNIIFLIYNDSNGHKICIVKYIFSIIIGKMKIKHLLNKNIKIQNKNKQIQ